MQAMINLKEYPVSKVLPLLLQDKTTKKNIIWATDGYIENGVPIDPKRQITTGQLLGFDPQVIQPRVAKSMQIQADRTKSRAEVYTPSWLCNKMNNHIDEEWFGRPHVFNVETENTWETVEEHIQFPEGKTWMDYVTSTRLEITCGEAPYLFSRYDSTTGDMIPVKHRIGILDRKLRIVSENTSDEEEWLKWAVKAYQASYGFEFQGDSLLIARVNAVMTFVEYMNEVWGHDPADADLRKIANIISWNLWQMDGLKGTVPLGAPVVEQEQLVLDLFGDLEEPEERAEPCRIYDWKANKSVTYNSLKRRR